MFPYKENSSKRNWATFVLKNDNLKKNLANINLVEYVYLNNSLI